MENNDTISKEELKEVANDLLKEVEGSSSREMSTSSGTTASYNKSIADLEQKHYQPTVSRREIAALKRANYDKIQGNFRYGYIMRNIKTGLVVEIRAASSTHACNIIGWRPKNTRILEITDSEKVETVEGNEDITKEVKVDETNTTKVESND